MPNLASMAEAVGALLKTRNEMVAVSESSTGGLISAALLSMPGASAFFVGGGVIYTLKAREVLLKANLDAHPGMRPSTEPYALLSATAIRELLGTTWGIDEPGRRDRRGTGMATLQATAALPCAVRRPAASPWKPGQSEREHNMWRFAREALDLFEEVLRSG